MRRNMSYNFCSALLLALVALFICGCQEQTRPVEPPVVKTPTPDRTLVETAKIFRGDELVGWLKTYRFNDDQRNLVTRVFNKRNDSLGYMLDDGRAYRRTAHGGHDLVANHRDQRRNVAAVFGTPFSDYRIEVIASAK